MAKARTIFIWEGPQFVTITKGHALTKSVDAPHLYNTKVKQKGLFAPYIPVMNIDEIYIGNSKRLMISDIATDFEVVRIRKDFLTHDPYIPDVPPNLIANIKSLRNEVEIWKKKYFDAKRMNEDREQKDRFKAKVSDDFDFVAKQKNKFFGQSDGMFGGSFASRWGLPPIGGAPSGGSEE